MDELRYTIQEHQNYRDKVEVYHKFPYKERPMMGVVLRNASGSRIKLSADDYAGAMKSHLALARAENREGKLFDWVWEDLNNLTKYKENDDLSSQTSGSPTVGTNRVFYTSIKPVISGLNNTVPANNFRQIRVTVDGSVVLPEFFDGMKGMFILPSAPPDGATVLASYYYKNLTPPGRYYIEMVSSFHFIIDPLYIVENEEVITRTTGTELTAQLENGGLYGDFDVLWTKKTIHSNKLYLEKNVDYTVDQSGLITFLNPLPSDTSLFANYRWVGDRIGPLEIPKPFHYLNTALPGVTLAFSNQLEAGNRMVLIVYDQREPAASVYSGHYRMNFDIDVFTRDPQRLADLTDHIIGYMWGERRLALITEGLTMEEMDSVGESEEVYDTNTGDLYYKNSINLVLLSEWKRFVPFLYKIQDFDMSVYRYTVNKQYIITDQNQFFELNLLPWEGKFEVVYPHTSGPRIF